MSVLQYLVTLTYADGSTFSAGGFPSEESANAWIANEKKQPYWVSTTTALITTVDITPGDA